MAIGTGGTVENLDGAVLMPRRATLNAGWCAAPEAGPKAMFEPAGTALRRILEREQARCDRDRGYAGPSRMGPDG